MRADGRVTDWGETAMRAASAAAISAIFGVAALAAPVEAAETFQKLTAAQIQAKVAGMEFTDGVHWRDIFERNGTLVSHSMGRKTVDKWRVQKNELCLGRGKDGEDCYQVWLSGNKVELRREGSTLPLEGILQRPR
jgi:hypothetical protein